MTETLRPRLVSLLSEARANTLSAPMVSGLRVLVAFALACGASVLVGTVRSDADAAAAEMVLAGRNTVRVLGSSNSQIGAASCDAMRARPSVVHAGGHSGQGSTVLGNGLEAPRYQITPGFASFLLAEELTVASQVVLGADLGERAGVRSGSVVTLDDGSILRALVLGDSSRTKPWSGTAMVVMPPDGLVDECVVEFRGAPTEADYRSLVLIDGARPLATGPLDSATVDETPAETRAATLTPRRVGLAAGVPLLMLTVVIWWSRRADWALYSVLGFRPLSCAVMAVAEWAMCVAAPAAAGAAWGVLIASRGVGGVDTWAPGRAVAVMVLSAFAAVGWLQASVARTSIRRQLAGL